MTRILILYGTTDGQTEKIARFLQNQLSARGVVVDLCNAATDNPNPAGYAGVLVAASVHAGGYQRAVVRWARRYAPALRPLRTAFISVCLGILQNKPEVDEELDRIRRHFVALTGWTPTQFKAVAGALPYTRYGWLKRLMMRRIVRKAGGDTDTSRDYEYTDWNDLRRFAGTFNSLCTLLPGGEWSPKRRLDQVVGAA